MLLCFIKLLFFELIVFKMSDITIKIYVGIFVNSEINLNSMIPLLTSLCMLNGRRPYSKRRGVFNIKISCKKYWKFIKSKIILLLHPQIRVKIPKRIMSKRYGVQLPVKYFPQIFFYCINIRLELDNNNTS